MTARQLCALRIACRPAWEALVREGDDLGLVSMRTSVRWRVELGMTSPRGPAGGRRAGAGRPRARAPKESLR